VRLPLLLVERPRLLDELRFESEWLLLLLERPLLAPIRPLWLLSVFFVGILNLRQIPASARSTHYCLQTFRSGDKPMPVAG